MGKGSKSDKIIIDTLGNDEFMGDILADHYALEQNVNFDLETHSLKQCYEFNLASIEEEHEYTGTLRVKVTCEEYLDEIYQREQMEEELFEDKREELENNIPDVSFEETSRQPSHSMADEEQDPIEGNEAKRQDANELSQNISSTIITIVSKLLSNNMGKEVKNKVKAQFKNFLKENAKTNSVISLVFAYLYFLASMVNAHVYTSFQTKMNEYLDKRFDMALKKEEHKRNVLMKKIDANRDLLDYLFTLNGAQVNFQAVRGMSERLLSQPSERNRQTKQLEDQLNQAIHIYTRMMEEL